MLKKATLWLTMLLVGLHNFTFAVFWENAEKTSWLNIPWAGADQWEKLVDVIKSWVNYVLLFLWLIVFLFLLWGGFLMITAAWDDGKYKKWFTILKQAWIGLIFIWVAWIIISFVLNMIGLITG